jgi:hypothetical protein
MAGLGDGLIVFSMVCYLPVDFQGNQQVIILHPSINSPDGAIGKLPGAWLLPANRTVSRRVRARPVSCHHGQR